MRLLLSQVCTRFCQPHRQLAEGSLQYANQHRLPVHTTCNLPASPHGMDPCLSELSCKFPS